MEQNDTDERVSAVSEVVDKEREEAELSKRQKVVGNVVAGAFLLLCGVFLLLCGVDVIPIEIKHIALPACLMAVGLTLLLTAALHRNPVSLWLSWAFNVPAVISLLAAYTSLSYANLYPFYIAIPAIASLLTLPMAFRSWKSHLKCILFFGVLAFLFMLNSLMGVSWKIVLPVMLALAGALVIFIAVSMLRPVKIDESEE